MPLIGHGFQNIMGSYFWYLPFASVRQCKYVMDRAKIPEDEWRWPGGPNVKTLQTNTR